MAVLALPFQHRGQALLQLRPAAGAGGGAQVEVRQCAVEQERQRAADRVPFPQHRASVLAAEARQFGGERVVVRAPVGLYPCGDLRRIRRLPFAVHRLAAELQHRAQAGGVLPRVQRGVVRRPVQIDHITRPARHQDRGAQLPGEVVQARHVPVGIGHPACRIGQSRGDVLRQRGTVVRQADQQRRAARVQAVRMGIVIHPPIVRRQSARSTPTAPPAHAHAAAACSCRDAVSASGPLPRPRSGGWPRCPPAGAGSRPASAPRRSPAGSRRRRRRAGGCRPPVPPRRRRPA